MIEFQFTSLFRFDNSLDNLIRAENLLPGIEQRKIDSAEKTAEKDKFT